MSIKQGSIWKMAVLLVVILVGIGGMVPSYAQGDNDTRVYQTEYSWVGVVRDCDLDRPEEQIAFTATWLVVLHHTTDAVGGYHTLERSDLHGEGVGLTSGDQYVISSYGPEWIWSTDNSGPADTYTINGRIRIVRLGGPGVWYTHVLQHYTINANGDLTSHIVEFDRGCH